jgi:hypothetical protein
MTDVLRPYQTDVVDAIEQTIANGVRRILLVAPTGSGKTVVAAGLIAATPTHAVVFDQNTPQDIADRTAATLRAIDSNPDNFHALLDGSSGCAFCGRALKDEVSKLIGVGPDCAKQNGTPHTITAANKRLELRRKLLGITQ